jgi:putative membrane protein insertion efficiency factor
MGSGDTSEEGCREGGVRVADGGIFEAGAERDVTMVGTEEPRTSDDADVTSSRVRLGGVGLGARVGLFTLRFYKAYLSMLFAGNCRFTPTCSQYSYEAVERLGLARGSWLTLRRLLRCHPFSGKFGFDPVPECCHEEHGTAPGDEFSSSASPSLEALEAPGPDFCATAAGRYRREVHI